MKLWKKVVLVIAALIVVAIACFLSWSYGFRNGMIAGGVTREMAELVVFHEHMEDQMTNADCAGAKQSIGDYLKLIEKYKDIPYGLITTETSYYGDTMLCHIRLARIERQLGNPTEATKQMELAKEACAHRKWKDCSEENMISFAKRREQKQPRPIACLANEK
jgi:hypothetical protein